MHGVYSLVGLGTQQLDLSKPMQVLSVHLLMGMGPFPCKASSGRQGVTGEKDLSATWDPVLLQGQLMAMLL